MKANKIRLQKLLEENNRKSPDVRSITLTAESVPSARHAAEIYEDITRRDLPAYFHEWWKTLKVPAELYFLFDKESEKNRFLKRVYKEVGIRRQEG